MQSLRIPDVLIENFYEWKIHKFQFETYPTFGGYVRKKQHKTSNSLKLIYLLARFLVLPKIQLRIPHSAKHHQVLFQTL
jgi:hypothetical protein